MVGERQADISSPVYGVSEDVGLREVQNPFNGPPGSCYPFQRYQVKDTPSGAVLDFASFHLQVMFSVSRQASREVTAMKTAGRPRCDWKIC